jgi:hypothetical protein
LHPRYTAWLLAHVAFGASVAPVFSTARFGTTLLAFFLAVALTAHALDELKGRSLRTQIPDAMLKAVAAIGLAGAVGLGILGMVKTIKPAGVLLAVACCLLASVQRTLSAPATRLRRNALRVSGEVCYFDGYSRRLDEAWLRAAPEKALRGLAIALVILAAGLVVFRLA